MAIPLKDCSETPCSSSSGANPDFYMCIASHVVTGGVCATGTDVPCPAGAGAKCVISGPSPVSTQTYTYYNVPDAQFAALESGCAQLKGVFTKLAGLAVPEKVSGMQLWLDAMDTTGMVKDANGLVATWPDKSGQGNHAKQGSSVAQPVWKAKGAVISKPGVALNGNGQWMFLPDFMKVPSFTVFAAVTRQSAVTAAPTLLGNYDAVGNSLYRLTDADGAWVRDSAGSHVLAAGLKRNNGINIESHVLSASAGSLTSTINGVTKTVSNAAYVATTTFAGGELPILGAQGIGGSSGTAAPNSGTFWSGEVHELLVYDHVLTTKEQETIVAWLQARWQPCTGCDDGNACTDDTCDGPGKCVYTNGSGTCSDGSACTTGDSCAAGACKAGTSITCDDKNPCTNDSCDPAKGCVAASNTAPCEDGNLCTLNDACVAGACKAGTPKTCSVNGEICDGGVCKAIPSGMVEIPAGTFAMGCVAGDLFCGDNEKPNHTVSLDAFLMDVVEVSVAKYKACVDAGGCTAPEICQTSKCNWDKPGREQHPINVVTWHEASAYCKWSHPNGNLPTEAQWERAARGGLSGKIYPWGDAKPTCTPGQPNTAVIGDPADGCGANTTAPVGTGSSKNGFGLYDMTGNVDEWCADGYNEKYYVSSPTKNPLGDANSPYRVTRGGEFSMPNFYQLRVSLRNYEYPVKKSVYVGFRCARSLP